MADSTLSQWRVDHRAPPAKTERGASESRSISASDGRAVRGVSRFAHYARRPLSKVVSAGFGVALAVAVLIGWLNRDEEYLVPDSGAGYWLGIAGGSLMLLLLFYPLRKRLRSSRVVGTVPFWFRLHMILGLIGPTLILFHSNFRWGSFNSNVAMVAMLIVAISGIVGRFLYGKIHLGLYGRKAELREILADAATLERLAGDGLPLGEQVVEGLSEFARHGTEARGGIILGFLSLPILAVQARVVRRRLLDDARRLLRAEGKRRGWSRRMRAQRFDAVAEIVALHLTAVKKAAAFEFYDRLFGLWHVLHLPLFFILLLAASMHVVSAHFY
jgi:hypothetical protein